jgi:hypothetical protein
MRRAEPAAVEAGHGGADHQQRDELELQLVGVAVRGGLDLEASVPRRADPFRVDEAAQWDHDPEFGNYT